MRNRLAVLALLALFGVPSLQAQYFGQNKVQYRHLKYAVIQTEHFEIHYYQGLRDAALDAGRMAERAYARMSRVLNHQYRERQPIILFASNTEFQQTNVTDIPEGVGGVTDPFRHRVMLPFTGAYKDFEHVLMHEMAHQFQFDVFARGRVGAGLQRLVSINPPLWFMEGMAEYLSVGPIDAHTTMWLRDAALEGTLPTIEQLTIDPRVFPYRFGHALWAYIGERWGDEVVGEILHGVSTSGIETSFRRALGITLDQLSDDWRDAVQRTYLPEITDLKMARHFSKPLLNEKNSTGSLHISPALSYDGKQVAYFSEGTTFFIDLYLADGETGRVKKRLIKSAFRSDFESLRFLYSAGSWSPDGHYFAIAVKNGGRDDLVIYDVKRGTVHQRITVEFNGLTNPTWSPDGKKLVFTGYDGGWSDLFIVDVDGQNLQRLTNDRYAELHPVWSPDGKTIAFATDRGPDSDVENLKFSSLKIALYNLETHGIEVLPSMPGGNVNPQWAPDGRSIAFVSDRTGTYNLFLHDLGDSRTYQLTNVYTGIASFSNLSPVISWARGADRMVLTYYEKGGYNVYSIDNPRSLKTRPYELPVGGVPIASLIKVGSPRMAPPSRVATTSPDGSLKSSVPVAVTVVGQDGVPVPPEPVPAGTPAAAAADTTPQAPPAGSMYRAAGGFRPSAETPEAPAPGSEPVSVKALLDSATLALPDTADFAFRKYSPKLATDFIARPSIGYSRDNFGNGVFGGSAISFSDILNNRQLLLALQLNGRIEEAQAAALYSNIGRRTSWSVGYQQQPLFFFSGSEFGLDRRGLATFTTHLERYLYHLGVVSISRPFTRFRRVEVGVRAVNVARATQDFVQFYDPRTSLVYDAQIETTELDNANYVQPLVALVFDNSVSTWTGPAMGQRSRLEYAPAFGAWQFHEVVGDLRRYDVVFSPVTLATRAMLFGRFGRNTDQFRYFVGSPDFMRGYTAGSFRRNECLSERPEAQILCDDLNQLIGSRIALVNAELRFPLIQQLNLSVLPIGFPPIEGAIFLDIGMAWNAGNSIVWRRAEGDDKNTVRQPLKAWGMSIRANMGGFLILRVEYTQPLDRGTFHPYWTVSIGPTF